MITESEQKLLEALQQAGLSATAFGQPNEVDLDIGRIHCPTMDPDDASLLFLSKYIDPERRRDLVKELVRMIEAINWTSETVICNLQDTLSLTFPLAVSDEKEWAIFEPLYQHAFAGSGHRYNPRRYYVSSVFNVLARCIRLSDNPCKAAVDNILNWMKQAPAFYWMSDEFHGWIDDVLEKLMQSQAYDESFRGLIGLFGKLGRRIVGAGDTKYIHRLDACVDHMMRVFDKPRSAQTFDREIALRHEFETLVSPIRIAINVLREIAVTVGTKLQSLSQGLTQWIPGQDDFVGMKIFSAVSDQGDGHFKAFNIEIAIWPVIVLDDTSGRKHFEKIAKSLSVRITHKHGDYSTSFNFKPAEAMNQQRGIDYSHHSKHGIVGAYVARARLLLPSSRGLISMIVTKKQGDDNLLALEIPSVLIHGSEPVLGMEASAMVFEDSSGWETLG